MDLLWNILKAARPRQWLKNLALLAPITFSGFLFTDHLFLTIVKAIAIFVLLSSSVYIFNDLNDVETDRAHPFKRKRPIAAGKISQPLAAMLAGGGAILSLFLSLSINYFFFLSALVYVVVQISYTLFLKKYPIVDVLTIASGYIIRVYAGGLAIDVHMNVWFLLTVISASLFLAVGKRRSELTLLKASGTVTQIRATLKHYTEGLLDIYTAMFATATWVSYALFTFNHPAIIPKGKALTILADLPRTLTSEKWMMITTPFAIYGVMRYLQLIYEKNEGESPERVLLSDAPLMVTATIWVVLVVGLIYVIGN